MRRIAAALIALLPVIAQAQGLTTLETGDDGRGWAGVGRLDLGGRAFCTGALIAPDLVLTAGHCLFDKQTGTRIDPATIRFLAGWRHGRAEAYRGVKKAVAHPDFIYSGEDLLSRVSHDLALIQLDQPIRLPSITPFAIAPRPQTGDQVGVVSYARERAEAPSLERACQVLDDRPGVLVMDCAVDFGASGSPVFTLGGGIPRMVSVVSSKADAGGRVVALGTALEQPLADLRHELTVAPDPYASGRALSGGGAPGAKFVRP